MRAMTKVVVGFGLGLGLGACAVQTPEPEACAVFESMLEPDECLAQLDTIVLEGRHLCDATTGGFLLLCDETDYDNRKLELARYGLDGEYEVLATLDAEHVTFVDLLREPTRDELWVMGNSERWIFDSEGVELDYTSFEFELIRSVTFYEGDILYHHFSPSNASDKGVERRNVDGDTIWLTDARSIGNYVTGETGATFEADQIFDLELRGPYLSFRIAHAGAGVIDLIVLDPTDGAIVWRRRLRDESDTDDPSKTSYYSLTGTEELVLIESARALHAQSGDLVEPARIVATGLDPEGETQWTRSVEFEADILLAAAGASVMVGEDLISLVSLYREPFDDRVAEAMLMRVTPEGETCSVPIPASETGLANRQLAKLGGGRVIASAPAEYEDIVPGELRVFADGVGGCVDE